MRVRSSHINSVPLRQWPSKPESAGCKTFPHHCCPEQRQVSSLAAVRFSHFQNAHRQRPLRSRLTLKALLTFSCTGHAVASRSSWLYSFSPTPQRAQQLGPGIRSFSFPSPEALHPDIQPTSKGASSTGWKERLLEGEA